MVLPQRQLEEASTHKSAQTHTGNVFVTRDLDFWPFDPKINVYRNYCSCFQYSCSIPFPFSSWYKSTHSDNTLSACLLFVQLQSNFRQSLTGYIADMARTFESSIWLSGRAAWNFLLSSLLPIPRTCLLAAGVYQLWAFCVFQPSVIDVGSYLCFLFPLFRDCSESLIRGRFRR